MGFFKSIFLTFVSACWQTAAQKYCRKFIICTMQMYHTNSILQKQRILIYNGDVDMCCNFLGDEWFVDSLEQPLKTPRGEWMYKEKDGSVQVGGWVKTFENIAFLTIRVCF